MISNRQASRQTCCDLSASMLVIDSLIENEFIEDTFGSSSGEVDTWLGCHNVDGDNDRWSCMKSTSTWVRNEDQSGYWRKCAFIVCLLHTICHLPDARLRQRHLWSLTHRVRVTSFRNDCEMNRTKIR